MDEFENICDRLANAAGWAYDSGARSASEPTALAALALIGFGRLDDAVRPLDWLARVQSADGSVGVTATENTPCWPTALAILAWNAFHRASESNRYGRSIDRGVGWAIQTRGESTPKRPQIGHDSSLVGWPWVVGTHSWVEPTALFVLALSSVGRRLHPRTDEALRLLIDRLLPNGGCNYGNTLILGQELLPHVQPTALAMLAIAGSGCAIVDERIEKSLAYLGRSVGPTSGTSSLCYGVMALSAFDARPPEAEEWLASEAVRCGQRGNSVHAFALLALASPKIRFPLLPTISAKTKATS